MPEPAVPPSYQTIAMIEASPLTSASWEQMAQKARRMNDPMSVKSLEVIIEGLKQIEELSEKNQGLPPQLSPVAQAMFLRMAKAYNSPTLLKEVGLIYLRDLSLPEIALHHFERSLFLGGPEKELRPLTEAAAVAQQRLVAQQKGSDRAHSGIIPALHTKPAVTAIIRNTGRMFLPARFVQTATIPGPEPAEAKEAEPPLPEKTEDCLREADEAVKKGAFRRAETLLIKANEKPAEGPEMWQAWTNLGQAAYEQGQYGNVESAFVEAAKFAPHEMASYFNLALGYHLNQKFSSAIDAYARANELQARHPKVWCNLGVLYFQMEAFGKSEEALRYAVEADPNYARAWDNLAAALGAQDKLDDALEACRRARSLRPDYPEASFKTGVILFSQNKLEEAAEEFRRAAALPELIAYSDVFLAMVYARTAQTEAAETAIRKAAQADPKCDLLWMAWNDLGLAWYAEKNYAKAATAYLEATRLKPDESSAWFNLGVSHHRAGDLKLARDAYQRAVDLQDALTGAWHNLGIVCAEAGDLEAASIAFRRETRLAPSNVRAWYDLGVTCEKLGLADEARVAFNRAEVFAGKDAKSAEPKIEMPAKSA